MLEQRQDPTICTIFVITGAGVTINLFQVHDVVKDLFVDLRSGVRLLTLIEMFTGQRQVLN